MVAMFEHSERTYATAHTEVMYHRGAGTDDTNNVYFGFTEPGHLIWHIHINTTEPIQLTEINGEAFKDPITITVPSTSTDGGFHVDLRKFGMVQGLQNFKIDTLAANAVVSVIVG